MAKQVMAVPLDDGTFVLAEVEEDEPGYSRASTKDGIVTAAERLQGALAAIRPAAGAVVAQLRELSPDELEVEFGIRLNGKAGAVIASTEAEGHFQVKLAWKPVNRVTSAASPEITEAG
jgi:hypothetical protein